MTHGRHHTKPLSGFILCNLLLSIALLVPIGLADGGALGEAAETRADSGTKIEVFLLNVPDTEGPIRDQVSITIKDLHTNWMETVEVEDAQHKFVLEQPGSYIVRAEADGYLDIGDGHSGIIQVKRGEYEEVELKLDKRDFNRIFNGTIHDADGDEIANAKLSLYGKHDYQSETKTNSKGEFSFSTFDDAFWVVIQKDGYGSEKMKIDLSEDDLLEETITLNTSALTVSGRVRKTDREPGDGESEYIEDPLTYLFDVPTSNDETSGGWFLEGTPEWFYEVVGYDDDVATSTRAFALVIDAEGYHPYFEYELDLDGEDISRNASLTAADEETIETAVELSSWNAASVETVWTVNAESTIHGLAFEGYANLRFQIDIDPQFGKEADKYNGQIDFHEYLDFEAWMKEKGPYYFDTLGFLELNDTYFNTSMDSFDLAITGLNDTKVNATEPFTITTGYDLAIDDAFDDPSGVSLSLGNIRAHETITMELPAGYEVPTSGLGDGVTREDVREIVFTEEGSVTIKRSEAPNAVLEVTPDEEPLYIDAEVDIMLDASGTSDPNEPDNEDLNYSWDFDYDGSFEADAYGMENSHNWTSGGLYNVSLRVRDAGDMVSYAYVDVYVDTAAPIIGEISVSGHESMRTLGIDTWEVNEAVGAADKINASESRGWLIFNASSVEDYVDAAKSAAGETPESNYKWYFTGEKMDERVETGIEVNFSWATPGEYEVELNVSDTVGNYATHSYTIHVLDITKPNADFDIDGKLSELRVPWEKQVVLDGTVATDNVNVTHYRWSVDDGEFSAWSDEATYNYTFTRSFLQSKIDADEKLAYNITLNVTDARGNWATETKEVLVITPSFTVELPKFSDNDPKEGDRITINTTVNNTAEVDADGVDVVFYSDGKEIGRKTVDIAAKDGAEVGIKWSADGGKHTITVGIDYITGAPPEEPVPIDVEVEPTNYSYIIVIVIIAVVLVVFYFFRRRRTELREYREEKEKGGRRRR